VAILDPADYPAIRAVLDTDLNETNLEDTIIALPIYHGAAEQDVLDLDADAETRTGDAGDRIKRAAIYFCAARLTPAVVRITSLSIQARDLNYSKPVFDPEQRAAELRAMAAEEIAAILEPATEAPNRPTMFTVARGYRGR
jgi:hypothetical protein